MTCLDFKFELKLEIIFGSTLDPVHPMPSYGLHKNPENAGERHGMSFGRS